MAFAVGQVRELGVADRRAQLDPLDADVLQRLQEAGEIAVLDQLPVGIGLAADRQAQRIRMELDAGRSQEADDRGVRSRFLEELSS